MFENDPSLMNTPIANLPSAIQPSTCALYRRPIGLKGIGRTLRTTLYQNMQYDIPMSGHVSVNVTDNRAPFIMLRRLNEGRVLWKLLPSFPFPGEQPLLLSVNSQEGAANLMKRPLNRDIHAPGIRPFETVLFYFFFAFFDVSIYRRIIIRD